MIHYTKLISEEHFTAGRPLVIVLPIVLYGEELSLETSSKKEMGYLIDELNKSGHWPILVYKKDYKMKGNMYTEIHKHGNYIILTSGPCKVWEFHIASFSQQLHELSFGDNTKYQWNSRAEFIVSVVSNCRNFDNKLI